MLWMMSNRKLRLCGSLRALKKQRKTTWATKKQHKLNWDQMRSLNKIVKVNMIEVKRPNQKPVYIETVMFLSTLILSLRSRMIKRLSMMHYRIWLARKNEVRSHKPRRKKKTMLRLEAKRNLRAGHMWIACIEPEVKLLKEKCPVCLTRNHSSGQRMKKISSSKS